MTLQATTPISLNEILDEFGAPPRTPLSGMVRGGAYVPIDDISGENSAIPTSTPISLSDFLSTNGNPNPYQIKDELLTPSPNGVPVVRLLSAKRSEGLFVDSHDATLVVPAAAQFVIDMKIRVGPNGITEPSSGTITTGVESYQQLNRVMGFHIGLTSADPETSSDNALLNSLFGWKIDFYDTEETTGIAFAALGSVTAGYSRAYMQNGGLIEAAGTTYEDKILPTKTNYVNLRLERGEPVNTISGSSRAADWILTVYENDNWTTVYDIEPAANGNNFFNANLANLGGYLCMAVSSGHNSGNLQMDIGDVRVFVGDQAVPW